METDHARIINDKSPQDLYIPLARLGEGAYARVFKARHKVTGKEVAIKLISTGKLSYKDLERSKREINIVSVLDHPHIAKVYEIYVEKQRQQTCLVQELLGGGDLLEYIAQNGSLPETEAATLLKGALEATQYLHGLGYAHRDLKPENLVLDTDHKIVKLIDFGFSKSINDMYGLETPIGTPGWQASDVMRGEPYSLAVDMWSIGCIVYFTLFAVPPFTSKNKVMAARVSELNELVKIGKYEIPGNIEISKDAQDFLSKLLEKDPNIRMTATQALEHRWMRQEGQHPLSQRRNELPHPLNKAEIVLLRESINIAIDHVRESAEEKAQNAVDEEVQVVIEDIDLSSYT